MIRNLQKNTLYYILIKYDSKFIHAILVNLYTKYHFKIMVKDISYNSYDI